MRRIAALVLAVLGAGTLHAARADHPTTTEEFSCGGGVDKTMAMENEYIVQTGYGGCWFHTGHHTFDLGGPHEVGAIDGHAFTVESIFSPPSELDQEELTALVLESSIDGTTWTVLGRFAFDLATERQDVFFESDGGGVQARYLRVRQPRSFAQGLSGYLDASNFSVELTPSHDAVPAGRTGTFSLACAQDIMEAIDPNHPCWLGGINRYDAPSVFHTYPLDAVTTVTGVAGSATFLPWRSDDYTQNGGNRQTLQAHLFASADGEHWTKLKTFNASYGMPAPFSYTGSVDAAYLRLVAEYHKGVKTHPALKHVRGMLYDSSMTVTAG